MKNIAELSKKIHDNPLGRQKGFIDPYLEEIEETDFRSYLMFNFQEFSDNYVFELLIELCSHLEKLKLEDWLFMINQLSDRPNNAFNIILFIQKFIRVNFYEFLKEQDKLDGDLADHINKHLLSLEFKLLDQTRLEIHSKKLEDFSSIRNKFLNEGVSPLPLTKLDKSSYSENIEYDEESGNYKII